MMEASPTAKDERPETGAFALSGPHHLLSPILAEIPPVTRAQVERMHACMRNPDMNQHAEPVSLLFGLAIGAIIGFYIRDSFHTGRR